MNKFFLRFTLGAIGGSVLAFPLFGYLDSIKTSKTVPQSMGLGLVRKERARDRSQLVSIFRLDPAAHPERVREILDSGDYLSLTLLFRVWAAKDPEAAGNMFLSLRIPEYDSGIPARNRVRTGLLSGWAVSDPMSARLWIETHCRKPITLPGTLVAKIGESDPATAIQFAYDYSQASSVNLVVHPLLKEWAKKDPKAATDAILAYSTTNRYNPVVEDFFDLLSKQESAAAQWALSLPASKVSSYDRENLASKIKDPEAALAFRLQHLSSSIDSEAFTEEIDNFETANLLISHSDSPLNGIISEFRKWNVTDSDAARKWLNSQPSSDFTELLQKQLPDYRATTDEVIASQIP